MTNDATTGLGYPRNPGPGWLRKESLARASPPGVAARQGPLGQSLATYVRAKRFSAAIMGSVIASPPW
jgi:hypothetical protein